MNRDQEKHKGTSQREEPSTLSNDLRQSNEFREQKREQADHQPRDDQGRFISQNKQKPQTKSTNRNK